MNKQELKEKLKELYPNENLLSCLTCKYSKTKGENDLRCGLTNKITTEQYVCEKYTK